MELFPENHSPYEKDFVTKSNPYAKFSARHFTKKNCILKNMSEKTKKHSATFFFCGSSLPNITLVGQSLSNIPKCPSSYYRMFSIFRFGISTQLQMILYPQVFYPLTHITLTASILMIVALTIERYCAVHYPTHFREVKCLKALI